MSTAEIIADSSPRRIQDGKESRSSEPDSLVELKETPAADQKELMSDWMVLEPVKLVII